MSGSSAPPPPNYQPLADASSQAARESAQVMREQLQWAKDQYADNKPFSDEVRQRLLTALDKNQANADTDRARYEELYQPLEDQQINQAKTWDSESNMALQRGRAVSRVSQAFDAADAAATRDLESFGVDPSSARFGALNRGAKLARATAAAGAANASDATTRSEANAMRQNMINVGKGYPGQVVASSGLSGQQGVSGVGVGNQTTGTAAGSLGNPLGWQGASTQALGTWGSALNSQYNAQLGQVNVNNNQSSGLGSLAGLALGAGMMFMSDEKEKTDIKKVGKENGVDMYAYRYKGDPKTYPKVVGPMAQDIAKQNPSAVTRVGNRLAVRPDYMAQFMADGGLTEADLMTPDAPPPPAGPVEIAGSAVPRHMSPSGGEMVDDVSAIGPSGEQIRLNADEFVVPRDVTTWKGEQFFQKLIMQARKEMGSAPAQPETKPAAEAGTEPQQGAVQRFARGGTLQPPRVTTSIRNERWPSNMQTNQFRTAVHRRAM